MDNFVGGANDQEKPVWQRVYIFYAASQRTRRETMLGAPSDYAQHVARHIVPSPSLSLAHSLSFSVCVSRSHHVWLCSCFW